MPTLSPIFFRVLLLLSILDGVSLQAAESPRFAGVSRVDFFGYTQCLALENEVTRVVLCHQAGGRVLEYSMHGKNSIWLERLVPTPLDRRLHERGA